MGATGFEAERKSGSQFEDCREGRGGRNLLAFLEGNLKTRYR